MMYNGGTALTTMTYKDAIRHSSFFFLDVGIVVESIFRYRLSKVLKADESRR